MSRLVIIDDEVNLQKSLALFLSERGHEVRTASTVAEGLALARSFLPAVVVLDVRLPDASGLDMLGPLKSMLPQCRVIVITAFHDMETTIQAMRLGAFDYLHKPLDIDELEQCVRRAAHVPELTAAPLAPPPPGDGQPNRLVGNSRAMRQIFKAIGLLSQNLATVLIQGETGTGKEVIARAVHDNSPFGQQPFLTIDCSTLVDNLMESELFGHEKGSFTGAALAKRGRLELAEKGTIFFDEVGELPLHLQAKLLRFLERREFTRVGGVKTLRSQARIIAATNRPLEEMASRGQFRPDLLFRLQVTAIKVPPLRERREDIADLVPFFLGRINREMHTRVVQVEKTAMDLLTASRWPGNVRELLNILTKAALDSRGPVLLADAVKAALSLGQTARAPSLEILSLAEAEKRHLQQVLETTRWNVTAAAQALGVSRPTLRSRLARHGLTRPPSPEAAAQPAK
ncbi:MAG: sigma-54-dependent Fis family transcriptional regulator [Desulfarculus sp.]|nr:sigma-54-dependent Fis family transcriptional regulator [Desulfarculus sp.]